MDREGTLLADQRMRILLHGVTTDAPYFLASNDELWKSWREIQAKGSGQDSSRWFDRGWKITCKHLPNGGTIMSLEVRFDPT